MPMDKIKVMLVDDQMLLREGLKTILSFQEDMEVTAEAENGQTAIELIKQSKIDVILMDIQMPVLNGVEATSIIKRDFPNTAIIILTTFDDDDFIIDALSKGADGYLLKDIDAAHLVESIRDAHRGQMMLPSKVATKLALRISSNRYSVDKSERVTFAEAEALSQREKEIGLLMAQGLSNRQIAKQLFLSEGTVKNYISELYHKLGTNNRTKAGMLIEQMLK
jgi:DNA-binding NarL/FixJ family response regulator